MFGQKTWEEERKEWLVNGIVEEFETKNGVIHRTGEAKG